MCHGTVQAFVLQVPLHILAHALHGFVQAMYVLASFTAFETPPGVA